MNFLTLCRALSEEVGESATAPSAVTNQSGKLLRFVNWINRAYSEIQTKYPDWDWMHGSYSFATVANDYQYPASQAGIASRFGYWDKGMCRLYSAGVADETELRFIPYSDWRARFLVGTQTAARPQFWSIAPNRDLVLGAKPDAVYTVAGDYFKSAQTLAADGDEPEMPADYHMVIVYLAMKKYARFYAAPEVYDDVRAEHAMLMGRLEARHRPEMQTAGPLA